MLSEVWTMIDPHDLAGLVELGAVVEEAGGDGVLIGDHVALGSNSATEGVPENPRDWLAGWNQDPHFAHPSSLELLSAIASTTTDLRLFAVALLTPLRHPLTVGKQLGTLDLISRGRLVYLPAVSWHEEEYDALDVPFHERGEILDEQLEIWARAWSDDRIDYDGKHFKLKEIYFEPKAWLPAGPTVWTGGLHLHKAVLRRAVRYASGYFPVAPPTPEEMETLGDALGAAGRSLDEMEFAMWLGRSTPFPDAGSCKSLAEALDETSDHMGRGITTFVVKPSQYIDDPAQLGDLVRDAASGLADRWKSV